jgi:hypothetical protein
MVFTNCDSIRTRVALPRPAQGDAVPPAAIESMRAGDPYSVEGKHMTAASLRTTLVLYSAALLASGTAGCSRATAAADGQTFRGVYEVGPNRSVFLPCGSDEQWYVREESAPARELRRLTGVQDLQAPGGGMLATQRAAIIRRAYAEVRGDTVAVTSRQPAIPYERELQLTQVLVVQPAQGGVCP